jgi:hypothetical protein
MYLETLTSYSKQLWLTKPTKPTHSLNLNTNMILQTHITCKHIEKEYEENTSMILRTPAAYWTAPTYKDLEKEHERKTPIRHQHVSYEEEDTCVI